MSQDSFAPPPRRFVSEDLDAGSWEALEPIFRELETREQETPDALADWLLDVSELEAVICAEEARRYIDMTCHTDDEEKKERYLEFNREIDPRIKIAFDRLDRQYLDSSQRDRLPRPRFEVFDRVKVSDAEVFNEKNVALETEETEVATRYTQLVGAMTVNIDGEELPLARACLDLEEPDRARRERAWRKIAERRETDAETIETIFGELVAIRKRLAANAGFPSYREFRFKKLRRFDYGVRECEEYHRGIREAVVPRVMEINSERREKLGVDSLRPWDFDVDPFSAAPFRPFATEGELCEISRNLFEAVSSEFARQFGVLEERDLLDLFSRANKAPGGYQYFLEDVRMPFIFANAAGTHEDVQTLLHEGGHAFHSLASREEPLILYRDPPIEFCEVASMGMEFLGLEHLERVYPALEASRARRVHLERTLRLLGWIATVDAFQHWVYTHEDAAPAERRREWVRLRTHFAPDTDWSGLEKFREIEWHRQGHLFRHPFYYIEYGIAQLGALQLWSLARRDPGEAVARYGKALALGGSRPLPELFAAAGLRFEFGGDLLEALVDEVFQEWRKLHLGEKTARKG